MAADGKHPKFRRLNSASIKRVGKAWRMPHGIDSKQRVKLKWAGALPAIGYRGKKSERNKHPCGKFEVVVSNAGQLAILKDRSVAVRFSGALGTKKKKELAAKAREMGLRVLN